MLRLSAFADEIAPQLPEQIRVCRECGITHFELRTVEGINVLDFGDALRQEIRAQLRENGLGVHAIASPIGKVKISDPWPAHFDRFKIAVEAAEFFEAPFIRLFSYYPPSPGEDMQRHRDEVLRRMRPKFSMWKGIPSSWCMKTKKIFMESAGVLAWISWPLLIRQNCGARSTQPTSFRPGRNHWTIGSC